MMQNRRNILTILGLAAASTPAMALEDLDTLGPVPPGVPGLMQPRGVATPHSQERMASALEKMAVAIRSGELTATEVEIRSVASYEEFMRHEVKITCELALVVPEVS